MAAIGDLVLVQVDARPGFFARIEDISPDAKAGWWQVKLLVLTMPLQLYTWTLDTSQVEGATFTMGGTPIQLEKVVSPVESPAQSAKQVKADKPVKSDKSVVVDSSQEPERGKVVSLFDRKNKKEN